MRKAGGIVAIIAGGFELCCASFFILVAMTLEDDGDVGSIYWASFIGLLVGSILVIFGAMAINTPANTKMWGWTVGKRLLVTSIVGVLGGNIFGIMFAIMGGVGGFLVWREEKQSEMSALPSLASSR